MFQSWNNRPSLTRKAVHFCGTLLLSASVLALLPACQRSSAYRRSVGAFGEEESYYARSEQAAANETIGTQKIEEMGQPRKRVLVFNFWNNTPIKGDEVGLFAADELRRALFTSGRVTLPVGLDSEFNTQDFIQGEEIRVSQLVREGRRLGVAVAVIGRISKITFRQRGDDVGLLRQKQSLVGVDLELKIFDISAGREIASATRSGEAASSTLVAFEGENLESPEFRQEMTALAIRNAIPSLGQDVLKSIDKMTWEGKIAKIAGGKVYLNAGRASGLIGGDILRVIAPGDEIYDPNSGAYLGRSPGQVKGTLEITDFIGTDGAIASVHTGGNFKEGDHVQLY
jgi:hypothetical protein